MTSISKLREKFLGNKKLKPTQRSLSTKKPEKQDPDPILISDDSSMGIILTPENRSPVSEHGCFSSIDFVDDSLTFRKKLQKKKTEPKTPPTKKNSLPKKKTSGKTFVNSDFTPQLFDPNLNCLLSSKKPIQTQSFSFSLEHLNSLEHKKKMFEDPEKRSKISFRDKLLIKNNSFIKTQYSEDYSIDYSEIVQRIGNVLQKLSRLTWNEIKNELFDPKDFDLSFTNEVKGIIAIIGVDPAPLTCGLCLLSTVDGGKIIEVSINAFRQRNHAPDLGCDDICLVVMKFIRLIDCRCIMWAIENQAAALKKKNNILFNPNLSDLEKESYYLEQYAVQFFITAFLPHERRCIISPSALKAFFGFDTHHSCDPDKQYQYNKEMAIKLGNSWATEYIKKRIVDLTGRDDPNIYDALLIAMYLFNTVCGVLSFSKRKKFEENTEKKKRKSDRLK